MLTNMGCGMSIPFMNRTNPAAMAGRGGGNSYAEDWQSNCPSEFLTGCVVPYYVRVSVDPLTTITHKIAPTTSLIPFASVSYLSDPDITIVEIKNAAGKQAGVTGLGLTTEINPLLLDWWNTISPWNPIPPDIGLVNNNKNHALVLRNDHATLPALYDAVWFGVVPGDLGIQLLLELGRITPAYANMLRKWLRDYDNGGGDSDCGNGCSTSKAA